MKVSGLVDVLGLLVFAGVMYAWAQGVKVIQAMDDLGIEVSAKALLLLLFSLEGILALVAYHMMTERVYFRKIIEQLEEVRGEESWKEI